MEQISNMTMVNKLKVVMPYEIFKDPGSFYLVDLPLCYYSCMHGAWLLTTISTFQSAPRLKKTVHRCLFFHGLDQGFVYHFSFTIDSSDFVIWPCEVVREARSSLLGVSMNLAKISIIKEGRIECTLGYYYQFLPHITS